ncbi:short-chain dehydrogenase, putative [Talaromyces stipitatus ATCC 10500]|uniref:3-oxoacyl-[acyl-carrier-protein] reductase n=1 Tax=Talaromyces stipitatus (strain ATCC 10500 / CBS 375.48 / QM 6759 / NRRL 1006) TaxID=441959 RepID=B8MMK4_TALSN|nr:short-chain dehydrogenase, putative [Talaromyces stipitatus ATCC 10500]EED13758.1 short-chain dehydrogenase, putative [Talaromyces stipitatus ATCC 10500]
MDEQSVAVITGGTGDIGLAIARHLAPTHLNIFLLDLDPDKSSQSISNLPREIQEKIITVQCDVTDPSALSQAAKTILSFKGASLKTLVNNAGGTKIASLHEMSPLTWQKEISLNLNAAYFCFDAFAEAFKQSTEPCKSVINISSVNGILGTFGNPAYSTAKAGLIQFTRTIAAEYGRYGIRANVVAPGTVMTSAWKEKIESNPGVFEDLKKWYPLGRLLEVDEVAGAVAFLASEQAKGVNGVCLPVDGGLTAGMPPVARSFGTLDYEGLRASQIYARPL